MFHLIALLDKPSSKSFSMLALLVRKDGDDALYRYNGDPDTRPTQHTEATHREMIHHNRDMEILGVTLTEEPLGKVAGWLGTEFVSACRVLGLPEPTPPEGARACPSEDDPQRVDGTFWIGPCPAVYTALEAWHLVAAERAFQEKNADIARLMNWCLAMRIETHAARWHTAVDEEARRRELEWSHRLLKHHERGLTQEKLLRQFEEIALRYTGK